MPMETSVVETSAKDLDVSSFPASLHMPLFPSPPTITATDSIATHSLPFLQGSNKKLADTKTDTTDNYVVVDIHGTKGSIRRDYYYFPLPV